MTRCKARRWLHAVPDSGAPDSRPAPFDEALDTAIRAIEDGTPEADAALIFARAHCAAYGCPGCFEEGA